MVIHPLSRWAIVAAAGLALVPGMMRVSADSFSRAVTSPAPQLSVRFPGHLHECHYALTISQNNGRPTTVICLIEGSGFRPHQVVRLNYTFSLSPSLVSNSQPKRTPARTQPTALPYVQCLMRVARLCRYTQPGARGHFGPIWVKFFYLLGDRDQFFGVHAYGGPDDRASLVLPYTRVVP